MGRETNRQKKKRYDQTVRDADKSTSTSCDVATRMERVGIRNDKHDARRKKNERNETSYVFEKVSDGTTTMYLDN